MKLRLKDLRKKKNMTQASVGEAIGVSGKNISKYETGSMTPDVETLIAIADYFNVSIDYLVYHSQNKYSYDDKASSVNEKMLVEYNTYDEKYKEDLLELLSNINIEDVKWLSKYVKISEKDRVTLRKIIEVIIAEYHSK